MRISYDVTYSLIKAELAKFGIWELTYGKPMAYGINIAKRGSLPILPSTFRTTAIGSQDFNNFKPTIEITISADI